MSRAILLVLAAATIASTLVPPLATAGRDPERGVFHEPWFDTNGWWGSGGTATAGVVRTSGWNVDVLRGLHFSEQPGGYGWRTRPLDMSLAGVAYREEGAVVSWGIQGGARRYGSGSVGVQVGTPTQFASVAITFVDSPYSGLGYETWSGPSGSGVLCHADGPVRGTFAIRGRTMTLTVEGCTPLAVDIGFEPTVLHDVFVSVSGQSFTFDPITVTTGPRAADPRPAASACASGAPSTSRCSGFREDFETGARGWVFEGRTRSSPVPYWIGSAPHDGGYVDGYWHVRDRVTAHGAAGRHLAYADSSAGSVSSPSTIWDQTLPHGTATSPAFRVPAAGATLTFRSDSYYYSQARTTVELSADEGRTWTTVHVVQGSSETVTADLSAFAGALAQLRFRHEARDGFPYSWFVDDIVVAGAPTAQPSAPERLLALPGPGTGEITLAWAPPSDPGTAGLVRYEIERWSSVNPGRIALPRQIGNAYADGGLDPEVRHFYRVRALNDAGASPWSNVASTVASPRDPRVSAFGNHECPNGNDFDVVLCVHGDARGGIAAVTICGRADAPIAIGNDRGCEHVPEGGA